MALQSNSKLSSKSDLDTAHNARNEEEDVEAAENRRGKWKMKGKGERQKVINREKRIKNEHMLW